MNRFVISFVRIWMLIALVLGCQQQVEGVKEVTGDSEKDQIHQKFGKQLFELGFMQYVPKEREQELKRELVENFNIYAEEYSRLVHVDAEALAEFSFDFFLPTLNEALGKRGVSISVVPSSNLQETLTVSINEQDVQLYSHKELETYTFWDTASRRFFRRVNHIMEARGCDERCYLLYTGNDLHAFVLTSQQFEVIRTANADNPKEIPYVP